MADSIPSRSPSLRNVVLAATAQDVRKCRSCSLCDDEIFDEQDISLTVLVQLIIMNDDEVLTSRTLWSDKVLAAARHACTSNLNLEAIILALRAEARRRGLVKEDKP
jgi:heterodisulfide reductase subunit C